MKKFFENKWVDHIIKLLLTLILSAILYGQVEIRDINKYRQPAVDEKQDTKIKSIISNMNRCEINNNEKLGNAHKRMDGITDEVKSMKPKIDFMYELMLRNERLTSQN